MELIERYLIEISSSLPARQRADVQAELRSLLEDALEDSTGGTPTEDDVLTLLAEFGPPGEVAERYRPDRRYLIGPELYPVFLLALSIALIIMGVVSVLGLFIGPDFTLTGVVPLRVTIFEGFSLVVRNMMAAFGWTVMVFALLQMLGARPGRDNSTWNPRDLLRVKSSDYISEGQVVAGLIVSIVLLFVLNFFSERVALITRTDNVALERAIMAVLPWLNVSLLLGLVINGVLLLNRRWAWHTRVSKILVDLFGIYVWFRVLFTFETRRAAMLNVGMSVETFAAIRWSIIAVLGVISALFLVELGLVLYRSMRQNKSRPLFQSTAGQSNNRHRTI